MADETTINRAAGDDDSPKISFLTQKMSDLQSENARIIQQNEDYRQKIDTLEETIKIADELKGNTEDLKRRLGDAERDYAESMMDFEDMARRRRNLNMEWEELKEMDKRIYDDCNALAIVIKLLLVNIGKLEEERFSLRRESDKKEKESQILKRELEVVLESNEALEKSMRGLEERAEQLTDKISVLEIGLADKKKVITEFYQ